MSKPVAGQWWQCHGCRRLVLAYTTASDVVYQWHKLGEVAALTVEEFLEDATHRPDCTGWDWVPDCIQSFDCNAGDHSDACPVKPQPAEDPEEWVVQDLVPPRDGIDQVKWSDWTARDWMTASGHWDAKHGESLASDKSVILSVRCRRKDLPAKPKPKRTVTVPKWLVIHDGEVDVYEHTSKPRGEFGAEVHRVGETTYEID